MKKLIIALCLFATPALAQGYYNDSQGEGSYNGSAGGTGNYSGMQNSHGAAQGDDSDWQRCANCDHSGDQQ